MSYSPTKQDQPPILTVKGYKIEKLISKTLQGQIYLAKHKRNSSVVVIKQTTIKLAENNIGTINNGKTVYIHENIIKEYKLMQYLSNKKNISGLVKCLEFFKDNDYYYLVMEYGGISFYDYIKYEFDQINSNKLNPIIWRSHVSKLFKQMCLYVSWLHDNNVCHLDISLENCLINNNIVNFCDFGLAELFPKNSFKCNKYCGKLSYQSPEVYHKKKGYDASKSDIWSLGVTLAIMLIGAPIYITPSMSDVYFCNIINGNLKKMITSWGLSHYMSDTAYDLLNNIFKPENERYTIKDILNHPFLKDIKTYQK